MRYKLIKQYPYSPELGTIVTSCKSDENEYYECEDYLLDSAEVENYPEHWQPESEWVTISKLSNSEIGSLHWLNTLLGRVAHIGEFIQNHPDPNWWNESQLAPSLGVYGKLIEEDVREVMNYFQDKLK